MKYTVRLNGFVLLLLFGATLGLAQQPFQAAIQSGSVDQVAALLSENPALLEQRDENNLTPLILAAANGQAAVVRLLLERGADIAAGDTEGSNALHNAAATGQLEIVRILLENGSNINEQDNFGMTPYLFAASYGHVELMKYFEERGADTALTTTNGRRAIHLAAGSNRTAGLEYLLERGASVNATDHDGNTALHGAINRHRVDAVRMLMEHGADANARNNMGTTPLLWAVYAQSEIVNILVENGAPLNESDNDGETPLLIAMKTGRLDIAKLFIEHGADTKITDPVSGQNLLHITAIRDYPDVVGPLVEAGVAVNAKDNSGATPLRYAALYGHRGTAGMLLKNGASDAGYETNYGYSPDLQRKLKKNDAVIWYLGHSGWAIKTKNHLLVFDYFETAQKPTNLTLAGGYINPAEIKDQKVIVFVSHEHGDHFDPRIFSWADSLSKINYVLGFQPETDREYIFMNAREKRNIDGVEVRTIYSNDSGVGFWVKADDVTIFHSGDHVNRNRDLSGDYCPEIDWLAAGNTKVDLAFLPVSGCNFGDYVAVWTGDFYAINKLKPIAVFPMHNGEYFSFRTFDFRKEAEQRNTQAPIICAMNRGDRFKYHRGKYVVAN